MSSHDDQLLVFVKNHKWMLVKDKHHVQTAKYIEQYGKLNKFKFLNYNQKKKTRIINVS